MADQKNNNRPNDQILIGVSSCLIGNRVRYDGDHSRSEIILREICSLAKLIPVCPEVEVGMPTPREKVQLEGSVDAPRLIGTDSGTDWTDRMNQYAKLRLEQDDLSRLSGFILKANSPSCGLGGVKLFDSAGAFKKQGTGLFAHRLTQLYPDLPITDDEALIDPKQYQTFLDRVHKYYRHHSDMSDKD